MLHRKRVTCIHLNELVVWLIVEDGECVKELRLVVCDYFIEVVNVDLS
jgi:hypothetical protein